MDKNETKEKAAAVGKAVAAGASLAAEGTGKFARMAGAAGITLAAGAYDKKVKAEKQLKQNQEGAKKVASRLKL